MNLIADLHTHTLASVHAYSTIMENVSFAQRAQLNALAVTDHTQGLSDAPGAVHFFNLKVLPKKINEVCILKGAELNILNEDGRIDLAKNILQSLDWAIASFHSDACETQTVRQCTQAYCCVIKNPLVDCIGHSGNPAFVCDYEVVVQCAAEYGKAIEINESSFVSRPGSYENCMKILQLCKKHQTYICVNSDAHFCSQVGRFPKSIAMLNEVDYPESLILNADFDRLQNFLHKRKKEKQI